MRPLILALLVGLGALSGPGRADDQDGENQTVVRERLELIPTIAGDERRPGALEQAAMPLPDRWGLCRLAVTRSAVVWDGGTSPLAVLGQTGSATPAGGRAAELVERREDLSLTWIQNAGTPWLSLETTLRASRIQRRRAAAGTDASEPATSQLGDLESVLVVPLLRGRYEAISLALGALAPLSPTSDRDWLIGHGTLHSSSWSGEAELRACTGMGLPLALLQGRLGFVLTPHGVNQVRRADGSLQPIADTALFVTAALGIHQRLSRWLRLGIDQEVVVRRWRERDQDPLLLSTRQRSAPLLGVVDLTPWPGGDLQLWAGRELFNHRSLPVADHLLLGAAIGWVY